VSEFGNHEMSSPWRRR